MNKLPSFKLEFSWFDSRFSQLSTPHISFFWSDYSNILRKRDYCITLCLTLFTIDLWSYPKYKVYDGSNLF